MSDDIKCEICKKVTKPSEDFPRWCVKCADRYGDLKDDDDYEPNKVKKRRMRDIY